GQGGTAPTSACAAPRRQRRRVGPFLAPDRFRVTYHRRQFPWGGTTNVRSMLDRFRAVPAIFLVAAWLTACSGPPPAAAPTTASAPAAAGGAAPTAASAGAPAGGAA